MYIQKSMNRLNDDEQDRLREWEARYRKSEMEQEVKKQHEKAKFDATKAQRENYANARRYVGASDQEVDRALKGGGRPDPNSKESRDNKNLYYKERDEIKKKVADASNPNKSKFMSVREKEEKLNALNNWRFNPKFTPLPYSS